MPPKKILKASYIKHQATATARNEFHDLLNASQEEEAINNEVDIANPRVYVQLGTELSGDLSVDLPVPLPPLDFNPDVFLEELRYDLPHVPVPVQHVDDIEQDLVEDILSRFLLDNIDRNNNANCTSLSDDNEHEENNGDDDSLNRSLQMWSNRYNITSVAVNALLSILRRFHPKFPKDSRTLKKTPRKTAVTILSNGEYSHLGLRCGILSKLKHGIRNCDQIMIDVFVDGVKVHRHVSEECWPILARCKDFVDSKPFVVRIFHGLGKPKPIQDYLSNFIQEVKELRREGIVLENRHFDVDIRYYLADAPACAYLKCIKGSTSYDGCERCDQEGGYDGCVFYSTKCGTERTDESFDSRRDLEHHTGDSPLSELQVKFISQFPMDSFHLIEIGVMKRILEFVIARGPVTARMSGQEIKTLSDLFSNLADYIPIEFSRKPSLRRFSEWKGTEFRLMMLYLGVVVLKFVLKDEVYKLYLLFHAAMYILYNDTLIDIHMADASNFIDMFVKYSAKIFGKRFVVYNVHMLLHLISDVTKFGNVMNFSAYPFEDKLGGLKRLVKTSSKPLQQICRRLCEKEIVNTTCFQNQGRGFMYKHVNGPIADIIPVISQYKRYEHESYILTITQPNNCVCLKDGMFGLVQNIVHTGDVNGSKIVVQIFKSTKDLYDYPLPSSDLGICIVGNLNENLIVYDFSDILYKCICLPCGELEYAVFPLLHLL